MLKASAAAGGMAWAAPLLSTSAAWGQTTNMCTCQGVLVYAKFAPGNAQTCTNQCLQPDNALQYDFDCLEDQGFLQRCDDVNSNSNWASIQFGKGTTPMRLSMQISGDCYAARCEDNFGQVYHWTASDNEAELFDAAHQVQDPAKAPGPAPDPPDDNNTMPMFRIWQYDTPEPTEIPGECRGNVEDILVPDGTLCVDTFDSAPANTTANQPAACTNAISGVVMSGLALRENVHNGNILNFIEMELCIPNASKIPCEPDDDCVDGTV